MKTIDLNCDLGESFGMYKIGNDSEVIKNITSANIACGFHASDPSVMNKTVKLASDAGVHIGAHPGFPDLQGFGRRNMNISPSEIRDMIVYQLGALEAFCRVHNTKLCHVKPHGALYNMAVKDKDIAEAVVQAIEEFDSELKLLAPFGSQMTSAAEKLGIRYACEVFADRAYEEDGTLVPRSRPGSMITDSDTAVKRVMRMITENKVRTVTGKDIFIKADSVCVHGDSEKALLFTQQLCHAFEENNIELKAF
ncbi:LamB/YcsF family protein [Porcipelethomonas sp.]|uniref:LamB/YcsF family protein n=1 Tax=Porcipelethomonas sp. TaxID=2981675 RepID=UPI003EF65AF6